MPWLELAERLRLARPLGFARRVRLPEVLEQPQLRVLEVRRRSEAAGCDAGDGFGDGGGLQGDLSHPVSIDHVPCIPELPQGAARRVLAQRLQLRYSRRGARLAVKRPCGVEALGHDRDLAGTFDGESHPPTVAGSAPSRPACYPSGRP